MAATDGRVRLAVIIVSHNDARWLHGCLSSVYDRAGGVELDVVVVDNGSEDETAELVSSTYPDVRLLVSENRGFAAGNNRALETVDADWILFLNPDTEIVAGTLADLIAVVRARPGVGVAGVRQVTPDGIVFPTMRRAPNAVRTFFESLGSERASIRASWLGERELDLSRYDYESTCDWTTGAFMLVRRETVDSIGFMDERFFLYCEETDFCVRALQAGWEVRHFPQLTIVHHANKAGWNPALAAQGAFARRQYMTKHYSPGHRILAFAALGLGYALRSVPVGRDAARSRSECARAAFATLAGLRPPPFGPPPRQALAVRQRPPT